MRNEYVSRLTRPHPHRRGHATSWLALALALPAAGCPDGALHWNGDADAGGGFANAGGGGGRPPGDSGPPGGGGGASGDDAGSGGGPARDGGGLYPVGTIPLQVVADRGAAVGARVSLGVPFPRGVLGEAARVRVLDAAGIEVPIATAVLARWPLDGTIRSVLVVFRATLPAGQSAQLTLAYGALRARTLEEPATAAPDGPVAATLAAAWYARSGVSGPHVPAADNARFAGYDRELERHIGSMDPPYETYGVSCGGTNAHRSYYDGSHALYQRFVRHGDAARYRRARAEARWFRDNELTWYEARSMAVHVCEASGWTPARALSWSVLRRMTSQGMLDDYLLTGDPEAREAVVAMGEAFRRNLPALRGGRENVLLVTERNMAWTMMGLAAHYAVDSRDVVAQALRSLVDETIAWQAAGDSGAFEHDIVRPDPSECSDGPRGASPFMTSLLVDALMDYHVLTDDARVVGVVRRVGQWVARDAITSDGRAFRYLWGCRSNAYDDSSYADLNLLIVHVFGAAYTLTGDEAFLDIGDAIAGTGLDAMFVRRPKQWNQAGRSFGRYLGYRTAARAP